MKTHTPRLVALLVPAALVIGLAPLGRVAHAAPSPGSLTVGVGGAAPASEPFSGGPITGSADGSGNVAPPVCQSPACESIPLTLAAPAGFPAHQITLTIGLTFTPATGNPGGVGIDGLDIWVLDSAGTTVASATTGSSPALAVASHLDPGSYTVQISGENGAVNETYTGTAAASTSSSTTVVPSVTQSPVPVSFAPASVVSPVILGAEPQMSFERPVASPKAGAGFDVNRGFVDWPVSSRTQIGSLWRTLNGGDSYRQIVDLSCAERQAPNCETGGGGDTVNRVNNYDATLNFGNQESLLQEAFASSVDHGDSFPVGRQFATTSSATAVDRQWISTVDAPGFMATAAPNTPAFELQALFSYHIPVAGELVAGVDTSGVVHPATAPVIASVSQSGPSRIDTQPGSHGSGYFYQSYRDGSGFEVGVAPLSQYSSTGAYTIQHVTSDQPQVFPWIALDKQGNLYAVWVAADGQLYYSWSKITDPANDPTATPTHGVPGTKWMPKLKVNPPALGSAIFPEVVAGDAGRIAITFDATGDHTGVSDNAPAAAKWSTYLAVSTNAMDANPTFQTGLVSHRVIHIGSICTSGTTCPASNPGSGGGDRSLLDMIDVTIDSDGRPAVVFTDNNNAFGRQETSLGSQGSPYVKVSKLANGPSLLGGHGPYALTYPTDYRPAAAGDATWPNTAAGSGNNLKTLDVLGAGATLSNGDLVGRIDLADATAAGFAHDLTAYNGVSSTDPAATRFQYVLRWDHGIDTYYLAADVAPTTGTPTFYGGRVDASNAVNNASSAVGIAYRPQAAFPVTGTIQGNSLVFHAHLADFGLNATSTLVSFAGYSLAGPADTALGNQTEAAQIFVSMRNIDASPPLDVAFGGPVANTPEVPWVPVLLIGGLGAMLAARRMRKSRRA